MAPEKGISGPHVSAAFVCEKVLTEGDGVASFIRVVDRFTVPVIQKLPPGAVLPPGFSVDPPPIQATLVISLKAGGTPSGEYSIKIAMHKPDGQTAQENTVQAFFTGSDDNGVTIAAPFTLPKAEAGLHWFDVVFEESLITRIPLRVFHQQIALQVPSQ